MDGVQQAHPDRGHWDGPTCGRRHERLASPGPCGGWPAGPTPNQGGGGRSMSGTARGQGHRRSEVGQSGPRLGQLATAVHVIETSRSILFSRSGRLAYREMIGR